MGHTSLLKRYLADRRGNIAVMFGLASLMLFTAVGAGLDITRLMSMKSHGQDQADSAALAAAVYMTTSTMSGLNDAQRKKEAREIALSSLENFMQSSENLGVDPTIVIDDETVRVDLAIKAKPVLMQVFGYDNLNHEVASMVGIGQAVAHDIDIALISDATGSMQITLDAIQNNMKDFTSDLTDELALRKIETGNVRVKFVFYRDMIIDNHKDWTDPKMGLQAGLEQFGSLYMSDFYSLPGQKTEMDTYVDFFLAQGGGSARESGLEAIWNTLGENDWGDGADTVRSVVLWTDAPTRGIGDKEESQLMPQSDPTMYYWNDDYWRDKIGDFFASYSKEERETYMYDTYAKAYTPQSLAALKTRFDEFHEENSKGIDGVETMTINVIGNCLGISPCGEWPQVATWEGVQYYYESNVYTESVTYEKIVQQVADVVEKQLVAKDLAIRW